MPDKTKELVGWRGVIKVMLIKALVVVMAVVPGWLVCWLDATLNLFKWPLSLIKQIME